MKRVISFAEGDGVPLCLDVWVDSFAVATSTGFVRLVDISRREQRDIVPGRRFDKYEKCGNLCERKWEEVKYYCALFVFQYWYHSFCEN